MRKKMKRTAVELFGDVVELNYNEKRKVVEAIGLLSPTDLCRLLAAMALEFKSSKSKTEKRISELSIELSSCVEKIGAPYFETRALVAIGKTVMLSSPQARSIEDLEEATNKTRR